MKNKIAFAAAFAASSCFAQLAPVPLFPAQQFNSADYYWNAGQTGFTADDVWSTTQDAPLDANTLASDSSSLIVGRTNDTVRTTVMTNVGSGVTVQGILNDLTTPARFWEWYTTEASALLSVENGIVNTANRAGATNAKFVIRGRAGASGDLALTTGQIYMSNNSRMELGQSGAGLYLGAVTLTDHIVVIGNSASARSELVIYTTNFSQTAGKNIYLDNGRVVFGKGTSGSARTWTAQETYDLSQNTIYAKGASSFEIGSGTSSLIDSNIALGDFVGEVSGDDVMYVNLYNTSGKTRNVGDVQVTGGGTFKVTSVSGASTTFKSITVDLKLLNLGTVSTVTGAFTNLYTDGVAAVRLAGGWHRLTAGSIVNDGKMTFDTDAAEGADRIAITAGYLTGANTGQITTGYDGSTNNVHKKTTRLTINSATANATYYGTINDMAADTDSAGIAALGQDYAIDIVKNGAGVQRLRGAVAYRGATTVNAGELYINADGSFMTGTDKWGIGAVALRGGKLGAIGATSEVGTILATDLTFSGGILAVDVDGSDYDRLELSGDSPLALSGGVVKVEVNILDFDDSILEYKIIAWDDGATVDADILDGYLLSFIQSGYDGSLRLGADGIYMSVVIPEPAQIAAFFGLLTLILAALRRRK